MPPTYTSNNKIKKIANGEESGTWGATTNTNFDLYDTAIDGVLAVTLSGTTGTLNIPDGASGDGRNKVIIFTGSLSGTNTVSITPNTVKKHYFVQNNTTGSQNVVISQGSGSTVTVKPGYSSVVYADGAGSGASVKEVLTSLKLTNLIESAGAVLVGSSSGSTAINASATASGTITIPAATDTLVGRATTDTLTNKTISGASNTLSNIGNSSLTNSSVTVNGTSISLGASGTVTANTANSLSAGTGLLGGPFNGSAPISLSIDSTVATLTDTQTLSNKTLSAPVITGTVTAGGGVGTSGQYLQSTGTGVQWATVSGGGGGTVTSITAGTGLSGGTITTSGTIAIDSTVATLTGSQSLSNKTLASAVLSGSLTAGGGTGTSGQFLQSTGSGVQWATSGSTRAVLSKTANYTVSTGDGDNVLVRTDCTSGAVTITLYTAVGNTGKSVAVKKIDSSANAITIGTTSSQTIDGSTTYAISNQYNSITVVSNGTNWDIV